MTYRLNCRATVFLMVCISLFLISPKVWYKKIVEIVLFIFPSVHVIVSSRLSLCIFSARVLLPYATQNFIADFFASWNEVQHFKTQQK